jgi:hypothetical protein
MTSAAPKGTFHGMSREEDKHSCSSPRRSSAATASPGLGHLELSALNQPLTGG